MSKILSKLVKRNFMVFLFTPDSILKFKTHAFELFAMASFIRRIKTRTETVNKVGNFGAACAIYVSYQ